LEVRFLLLILSKRLTVMTFTVIEPVTHRISTQKIILGSTYGIFRILRRRSSFKNRRDGTRQRSGRDEGCRESKDENEGSSKVHEISYRLKVENWNWKTLQLSRCFYTRVPRTTPHANLRLPQTPHFALTNHGSFECNSIKASPRKYSLI
jgi:hypothetical protein